MPTPKFANLQAILAEESKPETGVVSERAEERLEAEMRRVLIDFFERFFLWCALFPPVSGSRGMRAETVLTRLGERFGLVSQMDRSAVSIPSNIAEGYGRATTQDYLHLLRIARGVSHSAKPNPQGRAGVGVRTSWRRSSSLRKTSAGADGRRRRRLPRRYTR